MQEWLCSSHSRSATPASLEGVFLPPWVSQMEACIWGLFAGRLRTPGRLEVQGGLYNQLARPHLPLGTTQVQGAS